MVVGMDDVTARHKTTSGRRESRDTAYQSIEKRFRADLSRRLHERRVRVESSRGCYNVCVVLLFEYFHSITSVNEFV